MKAGSNHEYHILLGIEKISDEFGPSAGNMLFTIIQHIWLD